MANFVSFSGVAGSGKTTVVSYLKNYFINQFYTCNDFSFAAPLKDALALWFDWDRKRLDLDASYKEGSLLDNGSPDPYCAALALNRREVMQRVGTECMRNGLNKNIWIIMADLGLRRGKIAPSDLHIVSDARFINELEWIKILNGYRILITRVECARGEDPKNAVATTLTKASGHSSEHEFLSWPDYDEEIVNLIDRNLTDNANLNVLTDHINKVTIPAIRKRFDLIGKGKHDWRLYRT